MRMPPPVVGHSARRLERQAYVKTRQLLTVCLPERLCGGAQALKW